MARKIPVNDITFKHYQQLHSHKWAWLGKNKSDQHGTVKLFCKCTNCDRKTWVIWQLIRTGRSTQCKSCNRLLPNFELVQEKINQRGGTWQMQRIWRRHKQTNRREVYCKCIKCGRSKWITWTALQRGKAYNCRVCSMTKFGAFRDNSPVWKKNLWQVWKGFESRFSKKSKCTKSWKTFEEFRSWAMVSGFKPGSRLYTKKRNITHYSPETCQWVSISKSRESNVVRLSVRIKDY